METTLSKHFYASSKHLRTQRSQTAREARILRDSLSSSSMPAFKTALRSAHTSMGAV
jgi:hypothetical protein